MLSTKKQKLHSKMHSTTDWINAFFDMGNEKNNNNILMTSNNFGRLCPLFFYFQF